MRTLVALWLLGGCFGGGSSGRVRPAVIPMLSELPSDAARRDAVLDSAHKTAGPEQRQGLTATERKVETAAATAAAILGSMLSSTKSVTIGTSSELDESELLAPVPMQPPSATDGPDGAPKLGAPTDQPGTSNADLIPWIHVK
jgi:hypothetical protein